MADDPAGANDQVIVVLNTAPALHEMLTDWLLTHQCTRGTGFTSARVGGHSARLEALTPAEQVSGQRRRVQFEVILTALKAERMLDALASEFANVDIHYWVVPVLRAGRLSASAEDQDTDR
jgi:hypothetical protein